MAYLTVRIKGVEGYSRRELDSERLVLGRASSCGISIKHTSISREHCAFVKVGDAWFVEDMGSSNGTKVNTTKIAERTALSERDVVKAGKARLTFHVAAMPSDDAQVEVPEISKDGDDDEDFLKDEVEPSRSLDINDPPMAQNCQQCSCWFSVAHRADGDKIPCPRCGAKHTVIHIIVPSTTP